MQRHLPPHLNKSLLALAACAAMAPQGVLAIDLVQAPPLPTSKSTFVAPNVIISVDDSGSMSYCLSMTKSGGEGTQNCTVVKNGKTSYKNVDTTDTPDPDGTWPGNRQRINILRYALKEVFNDKDLIPPNRIRLAWQSMWNNGNAPGVGPAKDTGFNGPDRYTPAGATSVDSATVGVNSMLPLTDAHRQDFLDFADGLTPGNGTPSHWMFSQADSYMRRALSQNGPWSSNPGGTDNQSKEYLGCRRNYHIMMTDGRWNRNQINVPNTNWNDNANNVKLPDDTTYGGTTAATKNKTAIFRDSSAKSTLADWSFYSWAVPLQDKTKLKDSDKIKATETYNTAPDTETFTSTVGGTKYTATLDKYWNPKYDPATWPHMTTFTIGFSEMAYKWDYGQITAPSTMTPFGYDGSFPALANASVSWPDLSTNTESQNALDLWHASINGRGKFYAISRGEQLADAFREIIGQINEESAPLPDTVTGSGASSGYNTSRNNVGTYKSVYSPKLAWAGYITASPAKEPENIPCPDDASKSCGIKFPDPTGAWEGKTTADRLNDLTDLNTRLILSWADKMDGSKAAGGVQFKWATDASILSSAQKALLGKESNATGAKVVEKGENILNYIRGERSLEGTTDAQPFRTRTSRQGDIVNSDMWYTGAPSSNYAATGYSAFTSANKARTPILYAGGNDGMLHGFSALTGKEQIAYVPRGVIKQLKNLSDPLYNHQYFVDGSPFSGDVLQGSDWKTVLVGTLGAGGQGYFVLDVTNPADFGTTLPKNLVQLDRTRDNNEAAPNCNALTGTDKSYCTTVTDENKDIGNMTAKPVRESSNMQQTTQITRMNNDRWAAVMGNGYNSTNQRPVLLVQYLDGALELKRVPATTDTAGAGYAKDNGLAAPALVDLDGNGRTDIVYAGDNQGNLWKFDLTSDNSDDWQAAFGNNKPLFTAKGPVALGGTRNQAQPITAPPIVRANDRQKVVGSGSTATTVAVGGMMVAFGTGRNLTEDDRNVNITQNIQTLYSVLDNARYRENGGHLEIHPGLGDCNSSPQTCVPVPKQVGTMGDATTKLAKQEMVLLSDGYYTVNATEELKKENWKDYQGWYVDFPRTGERLLNPMQFYDGSNILSVFSEAPSGTKTNNSTNANESCSPTVTAATAGVQYFGLINIMDGKRSKTPLIDMNGDGVYNSADLNASSMEVPYGATTLFKEGNRNKLNKDAKYTYNTLPELSKRPSWRQLK